MHEGNPHIKLSTGADGLARPEGMEPYKLDPSGLNVVLNRLGVYDPDKIQNARDYMRGTWNDGPILRDESLYPVHTGSPYSEDIESIRQGEYSSSVHPLAKIGLYRGQGGEGAGPGWYNYPVRPLPLPKTFSANSGWGFHLLNIPGGIHDYGWGTKATGITNIATEEWTGIQDYEARKKEMLHGQGDPPIGVTKEEYHRPPRGQNTMPNQFLYEHFIPYSGGGAEMHGLADSMKNKLGSFSPDADIITARIGGRNPNNSGVMDTLVHEGMHRGQGILRQMYGGLSTIPKKFRSDWRTGQPDDPNYNFYWPGLYGKPGEGTIPVNEAGGPQTIDRIIPGDLGLELMTPGQRKDAEASGVPYLEDRFLNKPWNWTFDKAIFTSDNAGPNRGITARDQSNGISGGMRAIPEDSITGIEQETVTMPRLMNDSGPRGWGGEHVVNAIIMQKYPGGLDAEEMSQSARDEWGQYVSKMLADKEDEGFSLYGDREKAEDYSKQWLYAYTNAAESITKYLNNPHQWLAGGRKSTVQDRHIYGQYSPESVGVRGKDWPPKWFFMR